MKQFLYSVRDSAVGQFAAPFMFPTAAAANRAFHAEVRNPESMMNKHPGDYEMWCVGYIDTDVGRVTAHGDEIDYPYLVTRAVDVPPTP